MPFLTSGCKKTGLILLLLTCIAPFAYRAQENFMIGTNIIMLGAKQDQQWEPNDIQHAMDALVAGRPNAQERVIEAAKSPGSWQRTIFRCAQVLRRRGQPAHQALLAAIKAEKSPTARCNCIWVLQQAFNDYSHLDLYLSSLIAFGSSHDNYARRMNAHFLMYQLEGHFHDGVPPLWYEGEFGAIPQNFSEDFRNWCKAHTSPKGPLHQLH